MSRYLPIKTRIKKMKSTLKQVAIFKHGMEMSHEMPPGMLIVLL